MNLVQYNGWRLHISLPYLLVDVFHFSWYVWYNAFSSVQRVMISYSTTAHIGRYSKNTKQQRSLSKRLRSLYYIQCTLPEWVLMKRQPVLPAAPRLGSQAPVNEVPLRQELTYNLCVWPNSYWEPTHTKPQDILNIIYTSEWINSM